MIRSPRQQDKGRTPRNTVGQASALTHQPLNSCSLSHVRRETIAGAKWAVVLGEVRADFLGSDHTELKIAEGRVKRRFFPLFRAEGLATGRGTSSRPYLDAR
jgi:hypothetical protein